MVGLMSTTRTPVAGATRSGLHVVRVVLLVLAVSMLMSCGSDDADGDFPVLLVQTGQDMTYQDGRLEFTSSDDVSWFADRPNRDVGSMSLATYASSWDDGATFNADPPNAALEVDMGEPSIVELVNVEFDGTRTTYEVRTLEGAVPPTGDHVTLMIDGQCHYNPLYENC